MFQTEKSIRILHYLSIFSLITLIFFCFMWEKWFAPIRPGGSFLIFKSIPLFLPLFGILREKRYTYQWSSMFILLYVAEGSVRIISDTTALSRMMAGIELFLSLLYFLSVIFYAKYSVKIKQSSSKL